MTTPGAETNFGQAQRTPGGWSLPADTGQIPVLDLVGKTVTIVGVSGLTWKQTTVIAVDGDALDIEGGTLDFIRNPVREPRTVGFTRLFARDIAGGCIHHGEAK
ncbi:hypothetical protein ACFY05_32205 [Microtetraspora fusca]|uniref:Uncharacterized protein n=1 Tax=Microtetraspora fusca TaxID=1997 RepID=A0ABW6VDU6_MICFU